MNVIGMPDKVIHWVGTKNVPTLLNCHDRKTLPHIFRRYAHTWPKISLAKDALAVPWASNCATQISASVPEISRCRSFLFICLNIFIKIFYVIYRKFTFIWG